MAPDDGCFDGVFQSLRPGVVLVACSPKSLQTLRSFCFSLKGAALRSGSDATLIHCETPISWESVGIQIAKHGALGIRVFLLNRFEDPTPASIIARLKCEPGLDGLDGSIQAKLAGMLQEMAVGNGITLVVTTIAQEEGQLIARRTARMLGNEQGVFIALEQPRIGDDWYSATVTTGENEQRYGPLYFVTECPEKIPARQQADSAVATTVKSEDKTAQNPPGKASQPWYRRVFHP